MPLLEHAPHDCGGRLREVSVDQEECRARVGLSQQVKQVRCRQRLRSIIIGQVDGPVPTLMRHVSDRPRRRKAFEQKRERRSVCQYNGGKSRDEEPEHELLVQPWQNRCRARARATCRARVVRTLGRSVFRWDAQEQTTDKAGSVGHAVGGALPRFLALQLTGKCSMAEGKPSWAGHERIEMEILQLLAQPERRIRFTVRGPHHALARNDVLVRCRQSLACEVLWPDSVVGGR